MVLNFDDLRDQLNDILWYTWDPENVNSDEKKRHYYYPITQYMAEFIVENKTFGDINELVRSLRQARWTDSPKHEQERAAIAAIFDLVSNTSIELK